METIVLATANARYSHTSLALRYLKANITAEHADVVLLEFTIEERAIDIVERILQLKPTIVCLSIYIWNSLLLEDVARLSKTLSPETVLVLGGPEISHETEAQTISSYADYIIVGEGELLLDELIGRLHRGQPPQDKILSQPPPDLARLHLPYNLYSDDDIASRVVYLETSRGCPFGCEFCLSSRDKGVRRFPKEKILDEIETLLKRGVRRFKFIDRSIHLAIGQSVIEYFSDHASNGIFVHFELVPDRLTPELVDSLKTFRRGSLQLEAGIQTLNAEVAKRIGRQQESAEVLAAIDTLLKETEAHLHTDLVAGLPGESLESFARGFDQLLRLGPHEIQIGILKRLRGAPIRRHTEEWKMVYNPRPPYDILRNKLIDFETMQQLKRFARFFDLIYNSGNFEGAVALVCQGPSPFADFMNLSDWIFTKTGRTHAIALNRLYELVFEYICKNKSLDREMVANTLFQDNQRVGRKSFPAAVRDHVSKHDLQCQHRAEKPDKNPQGTPRRQRRHLS